MGDRHSNADEFVVCASRVLLERVDDLVGDVALAIQRVEPVYGDAAGVTVDDLRDVNRSNLVALLGHLSGESTTGLAEQRATGRIRAVQGVPLAAVLRAYRLGASVVWDRLVSMAGDDAAAKAELLTRASEAWRIFDEYTQAMTLAYQEAVAERAWRDAAVRGAALDVLFAGQAAGARLWDCAATLRLPPHGTFMVVAAALPQLSADTALPGVDGELTALGVASAWRHQADGYLGVVSLTDTFTADRLRALVASRCATWAGLSSPYDSLDATQAALRQAQLACAAASPGIQRVLHYENALISALLVSAPEVANTLTAAVLGPVLAMPVPERDLLIETLWCWFESGGEISAVAASLYCHRNTVRSRLNRIAEATGYDLSSPAAATQVYLAMEAHRMASVRRNGDAPGVLAGDAHARAEGEGSK